MKKKILIITIVLALLFTITINAAPGDSSDPIVVLSYLNQRIDELINKYKLENLSTKLEEQEKTISELKEKINNTVASSGSLVIVNLKANEKIIAAAGTELILRAGEATAITSELGGLSDVTAGVDIKEGQAITKNHHLLIPRDDGRGALATTDAIFMVRGAYNVISEQPSVIDNPEGSESGTNNEDN